ncbi:beta strand repeat-containing protein [Rurimicrobium arvi]
MMKRISISLLSLLAAATATAQDARNFFNAQRSASRLYIWDSTGTNDNVLYNGSGTWNKTSPNWTRSNGRANDYWRDGGIAVFGGSGSTRAAGTITLGISPVVDSISFAGTPSGDFILNGMSISGSNTTLPVSVAGGTVAYINSPVTGSLSLVKQGPGVLTLGGINTYSGITNIASGYLQMNTACKLPASDILCNGVFVVNKWTDDTLSQNISGTGTFSKQGAAAVRLTGVNTYSGNTVVEAGTLKSGSVAAFGSGTITVNNGAVLDTRVTAGNYSIGNSVTVLSGGTWLKDADGFYFNSTSLLSTPGTYTGALSVASGLNSLSIQGSGNYGVSGNMTGTGSLAVNAGVNAITLSGTNSYSGATSLFAGRLIAGSAGAFSPFSALSLNPGASVDLGGFSNTVGSLSGSGNIENTSGTDTLTAGGDNSSTNYSGILKNGASGILAFRKAGSGTLTLSGNNTYTGGTILSGGTLYINTTSKLASGPVFVTGNATLNADIPAGDFSSAYSWNVDAGDTLTVTPNATSSFLAIRGPITGSGMFKVSGWGTSHFGADTGFRGDFSGAGTFLFDTLAAFPNAKSFYCQGLRLAATGGGTYRFSDLQIIGWADLSANNSALHTVSFGSGNTSRTIDALIANGSGTVALIKEGTGTYRFRNSNSYSGGTTINGGTLESGVAAAFGSGPIVVNSGGTLDTRVTAGLNSIANSVTVNPGGTWLKDADGFYQNATTLLSAPGTYTSNIVVSGTPNFNIVGSGDYGISGIISGNATVNLNGGTQTITLSGANTNTGYLNVTGGTVKLGSSSALGSVVLNISAGAVLDMNGNPSTVRVLGGSGTITNSNSTNAILTIAGAANSNFSGVIQDGTGPVEIVRSSGTVYTAGLNGPNTFSGNVTVNGLLTCSRTASGTTSGLGNLQVSGKTITVNSGGMLNLGATNVFVASTADLTNCKATVVLAGGTLNTGTSFSGIKDVLLHSGGAITGSNGVSATTRSLALCGTVSSTGGDGTPSTISSPGATGGVHLGYNNFGVTGTTFDIDASSGGLIVYASVYNRAASTGTASTLTKTGTGILTLRGTNTYTGATTVNQGILALAGTSSSSAHTIAAGAGISAGDGASGATGTLTFAAASARLVVNALSASSVSKLSCTTLTAASGFTVDVLGTLTAGTYPILVSTSGTPVPTLGVNTTGMSVSFSWSGTTLNMTIF